MKNIFFTFIFIIFFNIFILFNNVFANEIDLNNLFRDDASVFSMEEDIENIHSIEDWDAKYENKNHIDENKSLAEKIDLQEPIVQEIEKPIIYENTINDNSLLMFIVSIALILVVCRILICFIINIIKKTKNK